MFRQLTIGELDRILERVFDKIKSEKISEKTTPGNKHFTLECANFVQTLIIEELNLINSRMSWLLISETFLVASYATLINDFEPQYYQVINIFFFILPIAGMALSIVALISILSAEAVLVYLGYKEGQIMEEVNAIYEYEIAEIAGNWYDRVENLKLTIIGGSLPNWLIPVLIIVFWIFLLLYAPQCQPIDTNGFYYSKTLENQFLCSSNWSPFKLISIIFFCIAGVLILIVYTCTTDKIKRDYKLSQSKLFKEIKVNYCKLLTHLLEWQYQPDKRSNNCKNSINKYRRIIKKSFQDRPSLDQYFHKRFKYFYKKAIKQASLEKCLYSETFDEDFTSLRQKVLESDYFPEEK